MTTVRIAAAQTAEYSNDIEGALVSALKFLHQAEAEDAKLLCFPEGYLQGYATDEVSARRVALDVTSDSFNNILGCFPKISPVIVMGFTEISKGKLFNSAVVIKDATVIGCYRKMYLLEGELFYRRKRDARI